MNFTVKELIFSIIFKQDFFNYFQFQKMLVFKVDRLNIIEHFLFVKKYADSTHLNSR